MSEQLQLKFRVGKYLYPVRVDIVGNRLELNFKYNQSLLEEVRLMEGAKYHGYDETNPRKIWSVLNSQRNRFQIRFLAGGNPYAPYELPLPQFVPRRSSLYNHQLDMAGHQYFRRYVEIACEMGTGKTLSAIESMEKAFLEDEVTDFYWVGPKAAIYSVQLEFKKWNALINPVFVTYDKLRTVLENWPTGKKPPQYVVFDEASRTKNPTAQRSQASLLLANMVREAYGDKGWVVLMSGSPAPKSPADWWNQCEIACPGFLKEGSIQKFQMRLAVLQTQESISGGKFSKIVTWKDDERKCNDCGQFADHPSHDLSMGGHSHIPSKDEVSYLYTRMDGLVLVKFKKDCLDLPDKIYRIEQLKPTGEIVRSAQLIKAKAPTTIQALTLLRELSDGFQYREEDIGQTETCEACNGKKEIDHWVDLDDPDNPLDQNSIQAGHRIIYDEGGVPTETLERPLRIEQTKQECPKCEGTGEVAKKTRIAKEFPTPKDQKLREILDEHEDVGRIVVFAAFTGSIERVKRICQEEGWGWIKVDGRGWDSSIGGTPTELLEKFQSAQEKYEKVVFIGQPGAAGMGLNLTASPTIVYFSNDFNAESRIQSEDRIHRPGADKNRGCTIIDLIHLPSDQLVLDNLKKKRKLQSLTLGQFKEEYNQLLVEHEN